MGGPGQGEHRALQGHLPSRHPCPCQVATSIVPGMWPEDRQVLEDGGGPCRGHPGSWALRSDQALMLEMRRAHLAQRIEGLEWELSLLLQVAGGSPRAQGDAVSHRMLPWPPVGRPCPQVAWPGEPAQPWQEGVDVEEASWAGGVSSV